MKKLITILLIGMICSSLAFAGEDEDSVIVVKETVNDGPYLFRTNDSTVEIHYINQGQLYSESISSSDYFSFNGKYHDSLSKYNIPVKAVEPAQFKFEKADSLFTISDIHGEYDYLIELLTNNGIIDENLKWSFGQGNFMIVGDIADRGEKVTEIYWLLYRLEKEAKAAGGRVHFLLGNHDVMILQNDLRYINPRYEQVTCDLLGMSYDKLYSQASILGEWLRSKPYVIQIGEILFVHGGLKSDMVDSNFTIDSINYIMRASIDTPREIIKADPRLSFFYGSFGPVWYRGYHYDMEKYAQATEVEIKSLLGFYDVSHIVVGHTVKDSVEALYNVGVIGVNQDYTVREEYEGMFYINGQFYIGDINGKRRDLTIK